MIAQPELVFLVLAVVYIFFNHMPFLSKLFSSGRPVEVEAGAGGGAEGGGAAKSGFLPSSVTDLLCNALFFGILSLLGAYLYTGRNPLGGADGGQQHIRTRATALPEEDEKKLHAEAAPDAAEPADEVCGLND